MNLNKFLIVLLMASFTLASCEKDPEIPNDEEVITTLTYTLSPASGGSDIVMTFQDLDGDGGNAPTISGGTLAINETYTGALTLLNETETPAESITAEIAEEDEEHQFFFESTITGLSVAYTDTDADGNPIGLATTVTTAAAGTGTLKVTLKHEPNKSAANVSTGDITNAGGETDIEVSFPLDVQ